ncbi:hypothetical protein N7492_007797 [Penicillium capsulatum]|uniref:IEC3 subunit of the Ino80 complex, chromatin re-modelling-domain-containing protein n=1 Tax=Penicillium capsulatum TaxID=69766 RepID=A0A9W9I4P0_9EURO|nr:hypothetical protein N7492_007797 [Penicillium capsulatum]
MAEETQGAGPAPEVLPDAPAPAPAKQSVRSFKKKYAKMKVKFELGIRENETLIREELRIEDLSKRIQEQNDVHVAQSLRYDLNMPADIPGGPEPESQIEPLTQDSNLAKRALKEAKAELANGRFSTSAYRQVEESIKRNRDFAPTLQYDNLRKVPHADTSAPKQDRSTNGVEWTLGYFTPERETECYLSMDAKLGDEAAALQVERMPDPPTFAEREREATAKNPASVINWLRRNQPQAFQDHEAASEKSTSRPSNQRASKRAPAQRKEEDVYDEDGMDVEPTPKNKRKRDEDTGYRPKGGSSRPKKKKEESTPNSNRSTKKA